MDTKKVFRKISNKLLEDFEISSEINHSGSLGSYRENALQKFLSQGRMPSRYGLGSGEIVGPAHNVSRQSDLIIFDQLNGFSLIYDELTQVYPIECVCGVIEVKSTLNKTEFITALENIKSVKSLAPDETMEQQVGSGFIMAQKRPTPFGAIFGYQLGKNSLDSLVSNLREWEAENEKKYWPNIIAVLNEGIIHHYGEGLKMAYGNHELTKANFPGAIHFTNDTLFKFYSTIIDLCAATNLGPVQLNRYFNPAEQVGKYIVSNHDRFTRLGENEVYKLTEAFIEKIVQACKATGSLTNKEMFLRRSGQIPEGYDENALNYEVYLYNPDNLKGIHEVKDAITVEDGRAVAAKGIMEPCQYIVVDSETYYIPGAYIMKEDLEMIPSKTTADL